MFLIYQIIISLLIIISPLSLSLEFLKKEDKKRFIEKFSISTVKKEKVKLYGFMVLV